jgi:hypothetical protein
MRPFARLLLLGLPACAPGALPLDTGGGDADPSGLGASPSAGPAAGPRWARSGGGGVLARLSDAGARLHRGPDQIELRLARLGRAAEGRPVAVSGWTPAPCAGEAPCARHIEATDAGVLEWWAARAAGVQQGWTVDARPPGDGPLLLDLELRGARAVVGESVVRLEGDAGGLLVVRGLAAWDADGAALPARFAPSPLGVRVEVDDARARWPVHIDPVYSTADTTVDGGAPGDAFGTVVALAGDVNGDEYDDIVVGAPDANSSAGAAWLFLGGADGLAATPISSISGSAAGDRLGAAIAGAGDVNGDGFDDVIIGAPGVSSGTGQARLYPGGLTGLQAASVVTLTGPSTGALFGSAVSGGGDLNRDGYKDVLVGAPGVSSSAGRAYAYRGRAVGLNTTVSATFSGPSAGAEFGAAVAIVQDINSDAYDDVAIGAPSVSSAAGAVYVYRGVGTTALANTSAVAVLTGPGAGAEYGTALSGGEDVDGNGYYDLIVGAPGADGGLGRAYVHFGAATWFPSSTYLTLGASSDAFGSTVAVAGDVDNDGFADLVVGSYPSGGAGRVDLFLGGAAGPSTSPDLTLTGEAPGDAFGASLAPAGDIDDDGYADIVVGAPAADSDTGRVYAFLGYADTDGDGVSAVDDCDDADPAVGARTLRYADQDGDGYGAIDGELVCPDETPYVDNGLDCDDTDPGAGEYELLHADADGDGLGAEEPDPVCPGAAGYTTDDTDCDDEDAAVGEATDWYLDWDKDGYGDPGYLVASCLELGSTGVFTRASAAVDCDDFNPSVTTPTVYYADADGDSYGDAGSTTASCASSVSGYVSNDDDCDDGDAAFGLPIPWYRDADGDGFGDPGVTSLGCTPPAGYGADTSDCDDAAAAVYPGATDACGDGLDANCDGVGDDDDDDEDGDGVSNADELGYGADACNPDDDGDGLLAEGDGDADYDGTPDFLDTVADPYAVINQDAAATNNRNVTLSFSAPAGTDQMCSANTATGTCTYATITANTRAHAMTTAVGTKTVWMKFRAAAAPTVITTYTDTIIYDTTRPVDGTVSASATLGEISLSWTGFSDALSGLAPGAPYKVVMAASATAPATCAVGTQVYTGSGTSTTISGLTDGTQYSFRVCATDAAGNLSVGATATETPGADQTGPEGTVVLASGATYTGLATVPFTVSATDDMSAVTHMCVTTATTCTTFVAYATSGSVAVGATTGEKTVYATFRDTYGNVGSAAVDTVYVDVTRPTDGAAALSATASATNQIDLSWGAATDAHAGLATYTVAYRSGTSTPSTCNAATGVTRITGLTGTSTSVTGLIANTRYNFRVCAVDAVGNISTGKTGLAITPVAFAGAAPPAGADEGAAWALSVGPAPTADGQGPAGCQSAPLQRLGAFGLLSGLLGALRRRRR